MKTTQTTDSGTVISFTSIASIESPLTALVMAPVEVPSVPSAHDVDGFLTFTAYIAELAKRTGF